MARWRGVRDCAANYTPRGGSLSTVGRRRRIGERASGRHILDFLTRSCDLAVEEIAKLRAQAPRRPARARRARPA
jgi:hypothetical protein